MLLRSLRKRHANPKYLPGNFLKNAWTKWKPKHPKPSRDSSGLEQLSSRQSNMNSAPASFADSANSAANRAANAAIDRNTSIRSVMTLPAYNPKAGDSEQVLGREGERGGIDTVVEFPETVEELAEFQRDEEMEALYQVRLARRTEAAEREERRRLRREARERGDFQALRELNAANAARERERTAAGAQSQLEAARAAHEAVRNRDRAVSSVSYADLGVARHDGTRIRANSEESERPLLGDAASMASTTRRQSGPLGNHDRNQSRTSVMSIDTVGSNELPSPGFIGNRSRAGSAASGRPATAGRSLSMSSPEIIEHEHAQDQELPDHEPPEYVDVSLDGQSPADMGAPPEYFSPIATRAPTLPISPTAGAVEAIMGPSSSPPADGSGDERRRSAGRGVGGVPQLPSLRLRDIPSITVSADSPISRRPTPQDGSGS